MLVDQVMCDRNRSSSGTTPGQKDVGWIWEVAKDPVECLNHVVGTNMVNGIVATII
jgi:hypothetical protein